MASEPSARQSVRESVALLVAEHGVDGAERELTRRFRERERPARVLAGLAYLRRRYGRPGDETPDPPA